MTINDIIEQHKTILSKNEQLRKSKSFSNIVWENYSSSFSNSFVRKIALPLFPIIAPLVINFALAGEVAIDEKIPGFVISSFFTVFLLPKSMAVLDCKNTNHIIRLEVLTLVFNLITLYILDWNLIIAKPEKYQVFSLAYEWLKNLQSF